MPHATGEFQLVGLEAHPGPAPVAQTPPREITGDDPGRHLDARRQSVEYGDDGGSM
jgi:hypothetical protein